MIPINGRDFPNDISILILFRPDMPIYIFPFNEISVGKRVPGSVCLSIEPCNVFRESLAFVSLLITMEKVCIILGSWDILVTNNTRRISAVWNLQCHTICECFLSLLFLRQQVIRVVDYFRNIQFSCLTVGSDQCLSILSLSLKVNISIDLICFHGFRFWFVILIFLNKICKNAVDHHRTYCLRSEFILILIPG